VPTNGVEISYDLNILKLKLKFSLLSIEKALISSLDPLLILFKKQQKTDSEAVLCQFFLFASLATNKKKAATKIESIDSRKK
jgi:hypothetical protein